MYPVGIYSHYGYVWVVLNKEQSFRYLNQYTKNHSVNTLTPPTTVDSYTQIAPQSLVYWSK